jgi:hypothetical protein
MAKLAKVQPLVFNALVDLPETRKDDYLLTLEVFKNFVSEDMSLKTVFEHHVELGLPSITSIARVRRKLQREFPELTDTAAQEVRAGEEREYRAYAINN